MSGEGDQLQPKAVPKAPTITSAFINKGAKTFAPKKAVRRRPAPAAPKPPLPSTSTTDTTFEPPPQTESQTRADPATAAEQSQPQPDSSPSTDQQATAPLPTPAATQEPSQQNVPHTNLVHASLTAVAPGPTAASLPTPASDENAVPRPEDSAATSTRPTTRITTPPVAAAETESGRPESEVRDEGQAQQTGPDPVVAEPLVASQEEPVLSTSGGGVRLEQTTDAVPERGPEIAAETTVDIVTAIEDVSPTTEAFVTCATPSEPPAEAASYTELQNARPIYTPAPQATTDATGERSWNAVNATVDREQAPTTTSQPRKPPGRRRRKAVTLRNMDEEEGEEEEARLRDTGGVGDDYVPPRPVRQSAKARGKRKAADATVGEEDGATQPPPKKKRQPTKAKAKGPTPTGFGKDVAAIVENEAGENVENAQGGENGQSAENGENIWAVTHPTPSRKRKRQSTSQPSVEGEQQLKRKGRPPRAPTPSDAEDEVIDEDSFFMDDLARRNVRIGKLSQREKKMREINWEEVKQRQKEKEAEQMNSRAVHAEMERQAQEKEDAVRTAQEQVRYENVGGEMRIVQGSGQVNYEEIADNMYAEEVVEEDDFTNRITSRSFMRNNKRYPEEFLLPGQGKRWDIRSTQDFYDALRMFGTDFGMMTTLFEGVSRRSLKLKFTREERKQPEVIKEILQQKETRLGNWDDFLKASGKENEQYDRVERIKQELEAAEEDARRQIEEAKAEYEEEKRQKRLAGFMSDEEGGENEAGKRKKGKKGKEKQVTFQDEDVEVLEVDENDGWGAE
ncbi:uncharacterized protein CC84DRAFT_1255312 [Paraphaeosphaeria sporulosa]|uniref:Transcription factor TFIIIB component B'' Myb domain-containing protein n=1 Tax=Paraphaeosphaeria sporulosa TaxID=1460663 RepID=A0A177CR08_9PLEO|nr:uncharacterized protein CC84DRAFT_1255312 [Paraphaeosphaeria sporulosa]OAG09207.1 hypothetical protein CC84DRAFT_1255312 [Paraphaeosphaeria sporulosa]